MNVKQIEALARTLRDYNLGSIDITEGELHIRLERAAAPSLPAAAPQPPQDTPAPALAPSQPPADPGVDFKDIADVRTPMVGVFYAAPAPDAPPYVQRGTRVKRGDVLCLIEAMKLMNEITAPSDGEIFDICAQNGEIVEFGQTIFKLIQVDHG